MKTLNSTGKNWKYNNIAIALGMALLFSLLTGCQNTVQTKPPAPQSKTTPQAAPTAATYEVIGITDGDTIKVLKDGAEVKVRLWGIDSPEKNQAFGSKAKQYCSDLAYGKQVQLEVMDIDRYGRSLGWVTLEDGRVLNMELVRSGFAWWYVEYAKNRMDIAQAEETARYAKRGLSVDKNPIPPWEFRKMKKSK